MKEYEINIPNSYAWQFFNIEENELENEIVFDFNLGIDKSNRKEFLKDLEFLTREDSEIYLKLALEDTPAQSPYHLDDENRYFDYPKFSFSNLFIKKIEKGKEIEIIGKDLVLKFGEKEIFEFFTKMYVNFEIYATIYDNIIFMNDQNAQQTKLVIWGVSDGDPIYY